MFLCFVYVFFLFFLWVIETFLYNIFRHCLPPNCLFKFCVFFCLFFVQKYLYFIFFSYLHALSIQGYLVFIQQFFLGILFAIVMFYLPFLFSIKIMYCFFIYVFFFFVIYSSLFIRKFHSNSYFFLLSFLVDI